MFACKIATFSWNANQPATPFAVRLQNFTPFSQRGIPPSQEVFIMELEVLYYDFHN